MTNGKLNTGLFLLKDRSKPRLYLNVGTFNLWYFSTVSAGYASIFLQGRLAANFSFPEAKC